MAWNIKQKTALVTGANSGIGKAVAMGLAEAGARVLMACRSERRGQRARDDIVRKSGNRRVDLLVADLSTTGGVRSLAQQVTSSYRRLHVLVNNAAVLTGTRRITAEGHEMQLFVNHLAPFMLTNLLIDLVKASAPARIINVSSTAHSSGTIDFDDIQHERGFKGYKAYANTKLMNIVFTYELARRLEGTGVTANCVHPGIIHTNLLRNFSMVLNMLFHALQKFFKHPREGADTPVYMAIAPELSHVTSKYFKYRQTLGTSQQSYDENVQRLLWEISESLTGIETTI
jgi:NAD(P)-dependent dehydrogenase (short-subunit alcohol dehydrogenase family)